MSVFTGTRYQRGHGLGSILRSLARVAMPLVKKGAKALGKEALKTAGQVASDAAAGRNIKLAAKQRVMERVREVVPLKRKKTHKRVAKPKKIVSQARARRGVTSRDALSD